MRWKKKRVKVIVCTMSKWRKRNKTTIMHENFDCITCLLIALLCLVEIQII